MFRALALTYPIDYRNAHNPANETTCSFNTDGRSEVHTSTYIMFLSSVCQLVTLLSIFLIFFFFVSP